MLNACILLSLLFVANACALRSTTSTTDDESVSPGPASAPASSGPQPNNGGDPLAPSSPAPDPVVIAGLSYTLRDVVYEVGVTIAANAPALAQGIATTYEVTPTLPAGLELDVSTGVISGTPAAAAPTTTYTVAADGVLTVTLVIAVIAPLGLGKAVATEVSVSKCPATSVPTSRCLQYVVSDCPGVDAMQVNVKVSEPSGAVVGTVVLGTGGGGGGFYETFGAAAVDGVILPLLQQGYRVVQRNWAQGSVGWLTGPGGPAHLACRYATLLDQVARDFPSPALCATGNSGGASEIAYAVARYGMGRILDLGVMSGGPPMGRVDYGCAGKDPALAQWWSEVCPGIMATASCQFSSVPASWIDAAYGASVSDCQNQSVSPDNLSSWRSESVWSEDALLHYPLTEMRFIFSEGDTSEAHPLGRVYADIVSSAKAITTLPLAAGVPHATPSVAAGAEQILADLLAACVPHH